MGSRTLQASVHGLRKEDSESAGGVRFIGWGDWVEGPGCKGCVLRQLSLRVGRPAAWRPAGPGPGQGGLESIEAGSHVIEAGSVSVIDLANL